MKHPVVTSVVSKMSKKKRQEKDKFDQEITTAM